MEWPQSKIKSEHYSIKEFKKVMLKKITFLMQIILFVSEKAKYATSKVERIHQVVERIVWKGARQITTKFSIGDPNWIWSNAKFKWVSWNYSNQQAQ